MQLPKKGKKKLRKLFFFIIIISSDGKSINFEEFLDYYYDVNATLPTDKEEYFIDVNYLIFALDKN